MRIISITGDNYSGHVGKTSVGCRCVVVNDGKLLLSHETTTGQYMLPGGGLEPGETDAECCVREVIEETGHIIEPSECLLEINEYYSDWRIVNRYFTGRVAGRTDMHLTDQEKEVGMEPRWIPVDEALCIFGQHAAYAGVDEMRRGLYLREYTALKELLHR